MVDQRSRAANRTTQPPHRLVLAVAQEVRATLEAAAERHDATRVLEVLGQGRSGDRAGLAGLLEELDVQTPEDLMHLVQLLTTSASFAALTWARALAGPEGTRFGPDEVLAAAWAKASWQGRDEADQD